jgi:hypothetical protein
MATTDVARYIASHQGHPPEGLTAVLQADFGDSDGGGGDTVDVDAIRTEAEAIIAHADERDPASGILLREYPPYGLSRADAIAFCRQLADKWGLVRQHAANVLELTDPKAGNGGGRPPPTTYDSFGGTWGPEHGEAFDLYPNGEDGPHYGYQFRCPAAGTVTRYSFGPGPLGLMCRVDDGASVLETDEAPNGGAFERRLLLPEHVQAITTLGTMMHIAVLTFDQPPRTPGGQPVRALWIGHCEDGFATGRRAAGADFCRCGNSGVEFPGVDASHGHVCGTATGQLSPNGDVPGVEVARLLGFNPRVVRVPGPADYQAGRADKGQFR